MGVKLREKKLKNGAVSFYLDIIESGRRKYEFLGIKAQGGRRSPAFIEQKKLAEKARDARQYQLSVEKHNLPNEQKQDRDLIAFIREKSKGYRSKRAADQLIQKLQAFAGAEVIPISRIDKTFLLRFQEFLKEGDAQQKVKRLGQGSIYMLVHFLSTFLNRAVEDGCIQANPYQKIPRSERVKMKRATPNYLTTEEIEQLARSSQNIHPQLRLAFLFSCFTGLRWSDCSRLRYSQISRQTIEGQEVHVMRLDQIKTQHTEYLPLSEQAMQLVERRKTEATTAQEPASLYVFPFLVEAKGQFAKYRWVNYEMKKWGKAAGLTKRLHFHLGRHTFATLTLSEGADLYTVSKLLGHTDIKNTQIYAHVVSKLKLEAVARLPKINPDALGGGQLRAV